MLNQQRLDSLFEGFQKVKGKVIDTVLKSVPDDVAEHVGNSEKEMLMAIRSVIDRSITKVDDGVNKVKAAKCKCTEEPCCGPDVEKPPAEGI